MVPSRASYSACSVVRSRVLPARFLICHTHGMGMPAARVTDMHTCPMVEPGPVPHVGGPIRPPCCPTVLIGKLPAARISDKAVCVGSSDVIAKGSATVLIGKLPAARIGDSTVHGGVIVVGFPT